MKIMILMLALVVFPLQGEEEKEHKPYQLKDCVWLQGVRQIGPGRFAIKLYNACHEAMYIHVCAEGRFGETEHRGSKSRVPAGGTYEIFTFDVDVLKGVNWSYGYYEAEVPSPCGK